MNHSAHPLSRLWIYRRPQSETRCSQRERLRGRPRWHRTALALILTMGCASPALAQSDSSADAGERSSNNDSAVEQIDAPNPERLRGDSLRMAGDLAGAVEAYHKALKQSPRDGETAYAVASTFALHGGFPDSAFHYLKLALEVDDSLQPLWDADLYYLTDDPRWEDIEEIRLDRLAEQIGRGFNRDYARRLYRLRMNEWGYRYQVMLAYRTLGPESPIPTAISHAMGQHHKENMIALEALIEQYGWPELSAVGEEAAYAAGNVLNHHDLATRQRYLPMLKDACERGEADWSRYAHIFDRTELELGNPQVFGTQMEMNEETGRYEPRPMIDPADVNKRRAAKGMEPIEAQLQRFNESMERDFGS